MIGAPRILTDPDVERGLDALAQTLLGDPSLWPEIVSMNNLVPPYLTLDPVQAFGLPMEAATLPEAVAAGADSFALSVSQQQWQAGYTVALAASSTAGVTAEAPVIQSYDGSTLVLRVPLQNAYPQGASLLLYSPTPIGGTQVLMPGQVLYLPVSSTSAVSGMVITAGGETTDVFGSDALMPATWAGGDLAVVQGPAVLAQRLRAAILTQAGSLPNAPSFGSRLHQVVGAPPRSVKWATWVRQALLALPEVADVEGVAATVAGNVLTFSAQVFVHTSGPPLVLQGESLTLPILG